MWAGAAALVAVLAAFLALGRSGGGDPFAEPSFNTTSTSTSTTSTTEAAPTSDCIDVANPSMLATIDATNAAAVATGSRGWFLAKANGATWWTTADPTVDAAGELVPMNDQAREDSDSRRDLPEGDPLYEGHTDDEPEADAARECAGVP